MVSSKIQGMPISSDFPKFGHILQSLYIFAVYTVPLIAIVLVNLHTRKSVEVKKESSKSECKV